MRPSKKRVGTHFFSVSETVASAAAWGGGRRREHEVQGVGAGVLTSVPALCMESVRMRSGVSYLVW